MKLKSLLIAAFAVALSWSQAFGQATILPPGETCFSALGPTSGGPNNTGTGYIGLLGTITPGSAYTNGTYGGVSLTGGSGSNATANIVVSGGIVTQVTILNPGINYVVGDVLSASAASIGGTGSGFSVPVSSVALNFALAGGSVGFYIPGTLLVKQTWQDAGETTLNQNPVTLDSNGCAVIYGAGIYRMIVKDSLGNTAWDKLTASTGPAGLFWTGTAGGTGNAITVTDSNFALQDGATIQFRAIATNSGPATISVSGGAPIAVVRDTSTGPAALSGSEIAAGNTPMVTYDATNVEFHIVNPSSTGSSSTGGVAIITPQGYLNLVGQASGDVVQTGDVVAATTVFYSPFVGTQLPIWNGSSYVIFNISELTATLTAAGSPSNTIQDLCVFSNNGVATLAVGPSWTTVTAGAGSRGTGAGTAQITRLNGLWVNAVQIVGYNGLSSFNIPASQCTYVGSISIDATAGQVSAYRALGQSRKFGIWNAYNRQTIELDVADPNSSWTTATSGWRQSRGDSTNFAASFTGLPEEIIQAEFAQSITVGIPNAASTTANIGIGINSTTGINGTLGVNAFVNNNAQSASIQQTARAMTNLAPTIGINNFNTLEQVPVGVTTNANYLGTSSSMRLKLTWRG